ncbi:DUF899 family protein [Janthinobacterium sp.]|uniref:DUF899 family protein n=1 Tax=Janthinobacterium sp. TaxID=1871054 RepID=UPI00261E4859|nr:DUF899 family protein [Janthinobacterium sp.]
MSTLEPAATLAAKASKPYPNDSDEYRSARVALLAEEIELRRHIMRRPMTAMRAISGGLAPDGSEWPALDIWVKRNGKVYHFWGAELGGTQDPGQDPRGAPDPTPLWNLLDLTPAGRGKDWYPQLAY